MGLVSLALRLATVRALRGKTYAGDRVHDSQIAPLDETIRAERAPHIVIYTDEDAREVQGRDLMVADRMLDLVIELVVADKVGVTVENQEVSQAIVIPQTDAALEAQINLMERQALRALLAEAGVWPELWRVLVVRVVKVFSRRGSNAEGVRFAARQITLQVDTLAEPPFETASGIWADFLAAMRAEPELAGLAEIVAAEIATPNLTGYEAAKAALGLAQDEAHGIGLAEPDADQGDPSGDEEISSDDADEALPPEPAP
jgi:hypothetical protein